MSNSWFRFKQFTIHQDRTAMKVCTDSCILGAWTAVRIAGIVSLLDIGTGTGLLPLMLAQKSNAVIDAIETDPESAAQARENIEAADQSRRIRVIEGDAKKYAFQQKYDFMICNPPFYESDLKSPDRKKNNAKHEESLSLEELVTVIKTNLSAVGRFSILLPFHRTGYFANLATQNGFFLEEKLTVKQTPAHTPFRSICLYSREKSQEISEEELTIKEAAGDYSMKFKELMEAYYG